MQPKDSQETLAVEEIWGKFDPNGLEFCHKAYCVLLYHGYGITIAITLYNNSKNSRQLGETGEKLMIYPLVIKRG